MATPIQVGPLALSISKTLNGMAETKPMHDALMPSMMHARYREIIVGISTAFIDHGGMNGEMVRKELEAAQACIGSDRAHELEQLATNIASKLEGQTEH